MIKKIDTKMITQVVEKCSRKLKLKNCYWFTYVSLALATLPVDFFDKGITNNTHANTKSTNKTDTSKPISVETNSQSSNSSTLPEGNSIS